MTQVFAHRGAHENARENTLDAFIGAKGLGVDGVELDVRRTRDGNLVIHHDPSAGGLLIGETKLTELPNYVPSLEAALDVLGGLSVNVEIKNSKDPDEPFYDDSGSLVRDVLSVIEGSQHDGAVTISCFDLATCATARAQSDDVPVSFLVWDVALDVALAQAHEVALAGVNPYFAQVTKSAKELADSLGLLISTWTVNEDDDILAMAALGVASVITDQPARALALVR